MFNYYDEDDQLSFDYNNMATTSLPPLKSILSGGTLSTSTPTVSVTSPTYTYAPGGAGMTLTTTVGGAGATWTNQTVTATAAPTTVYTINDSSNAWGYANAWGVNKTLRVDGDAEFEGDITIKGVKLTERLDEIEKRLAILRPNNDLEGKWDELKELGERYRQLEQEILEKEKVWEILKK